MVTSKKQNNNAETEKMIGDLADAARRKRRTAEHLEAAIERHQMKQKTFLPLVCPACNHTDINHESGERYRCQRCRWAVRVSTNGDAVDYISLRTAGKKGRIAGRVRP